MSRSDLSSGRTRNRSCRSSIVCTYLLAHERLRIIGDPHRIFDSVRSVIDATGVFKGKARTALDSTLLDEATATHDTITRLISAIRLLRRVAALNLLRLVILGLDHDGGWRRRST